MRAVLESRKVRKVLSAASSAFAVVCCACTSASSPALHQDTREAGQHDAVIAVGSFDFPESVLLAEIYGGALAAKGFPVRIQPDLGSRELVDPALMGGLLQLVPEYAGSAVDFLSLGRLPTTSDVAATNLALADLVARQRLVVGKPAAAQDANVIVVTAATAARYHLRSVADLAGAAPRLVFGGPPECPGRAYCLPGLKRVYGLRFRKFVALDAGGPLTLQAIEGRHVDIALMFSTDPRIAARHLVVLADDRGLQPAENVTPLLRGDVVARFGACLVDVLNAVSGRLDTSSLRALDAQVELSGRDPRRVAGDWLHSQGLAGRDSVR
jgi:osmoprotectant transport system substrate-binding protein